MVYRCKIRKKIQIMSTFALFFSEFATFRHVHTSNR